MTQLLEEPSTKTIQTQPGLADLAWMNNSHSYGGRAVEGGGMEG